MPPLDLRLIPLAETRALRRDVLRPYMTVDELAQHEPGEAGTKVLQALVQHAISHGATRLWCNARTPARSLYERAGFEATSDEFETPRIGPHYRMELQTRQDG